MALTPEEALDIFPCVWLVYQRSPEYLEKMKEAQEIALLNEGVL